MIVEIKSKTLGPCCDDWISKLEVVNNLGCSIYKENSVEILVEFFTKKNYPHIKSICQDLLAVIE
jgi:hypothetical protein